MIIYRLDDIPDAGDRPYPGRLGDVASSSSLQIFSKVLNVLMEEVGFVSQEDDDDFTVRRYTLPDAEDKKFNCSLRIFTVGPALLIQGHF